MPPKFQLYKDTAEKFRFRIVAENGQTVASSEAYEAYKSCIKGINSVKKNARSEVEDLTIDDRKVLHPKYQIYEDAAEEFRFRLRASNGEITAQSEGYETKDACINGIGVVKRSYNAEIDESEIAGKSEEPATSVTEKKYAKPSKTKVAETRVKVPTVPLPEVKKPEIEEPKLESPVVEMPKTEAPEATMVLPEVEELRQQILVPPVETNIPKKAGEVEAKPKGVSILKELLVSFVGLLIALIISALALSIANWGIDFFGITGDVATASAILAVAIVIGPTIAAFATKKFF